MNTLSELDQVIGKLGLKQTMMRLGVGCFRKVLEKPQKSPYVGQSLQ
jgi:hypothetical protein